MSASSDTTINYAFRLSAGFGFGSDFGPIYVLSRRAVETMHRTGFGHVNDVSF